MNKQIRKWVKLKVCSQSHLLGHLPDRLYAGAVQVVVVLARLDELVVLDVLLHLLPGHHEVVVPGVHLVVPLGPRRVCRTTETPFTLTGLPLR